MSFTVYKSSAGSGKTYTLVKEYLKIVLQDKEVKRYKSILAITFTNKAAAEMKERVIDALTSISSNKKLEGTSFHLLKDLEKELQLDAASIQTKCAAVLTSMLHNYSDISISTIDKFVYKIVRNFAYDLQLPVNFSIEMDSDNLLQTAIDLLIARVGGDEKLTQALVAFAERKADEERSWNIENDLKNFSFDLLKEQYTEYLSELKKLSLQDFFEIKNKLHLLTSDFEMELKRIGDKALHLISENNIDHKDLAGGAKSGIGKYFSYLKEKRASNYKATDTIEKYVREDNWEATKATAQSRNNIRNCKEELKTLFYEAKKILELGYSNYLLHDAVERNIYAVSVLNEIEKIIVEIKKENNQVHISEFSKKIAAIVMNEPVPFIYERIGEKYKNYLIDEFQDTSILQWQNFIPLLENSLATNEFNMLVGDGKQAIYRWRGGEVEQFMGLPAILNADGSVLLKSREGALKRNFQEKKLTHNRRSKREIIEFNNSFFRFVVQQESFPSFLKPIYDSLEQEFEPNNSGGFVHFHFLNKVEENYVADEKTCHYTLELIKKALSDNYQLRDIAILTRNNKNGVALSKFLIEAGIDVVSKESLLLQTSSKVNFVVNALYYISDPENSIAKAGIMEFILKSEPSFETINLNNYFKSEILFSSYVKKRFPTWNTTKFLQLPLYELCEELIRTFKLNEQADPYIIFFLDAVYGFISKFTNSIVDFLDWWERKKESLSIVIPQGLNAVNVLTIHKAKGLEFPIVIFPYANWSARKPVENLWVHLQDENIPKLKVALLPLKSNLGRTQYDDAYIAEMGKKKLDDLNLLYVAFTRAINKLYVICEPPEGAKNLSKYYIDFLTHKGLWREELVDYSFGQEIENSTQRKKNEKTVLNYLTAVVSNDWRQKISLLKQSDKLWKEEKAGLEKDYGNLIHTALSKIMTLKDIEKSLASMLIEGLISKSEESHLNQKLKQLLSRPEIQPFFENGLSVKTEAEILLAKGSIYRPDRIVFYPEKTVVLDFKTGVELEKHRTQVSEYATTLHQMGYLQVEKFLVYTETEKLIRVN